MFWCCKRTSLNPSSIVQNMKNPEMQFTVAYQKYSDEIFRFCYYRVFDRDKAKDIAQETFIKTWKQLADGVEKKSP